MTRNERDRKAKERDWAVTGHATPVKRVEGAPRPIKQAQPVVSGKQTSILHWVDAALDRFDARKGKTHRESPVSESA